MSNQDEQAPQQPSTQHLYTRKQRTFPLEEQDTVRISVYDRMQRKRRLLAKQSTVKVPLVDGAQRKRRLLEEQDTVIFSLVDGAQDEKVQASSSFDSQETDPQVSIQQERTVPLPALPPLGSSRLRSYRQALASDISNLELHDNSHREKFVSLPTLVLEAVTLQQGQSEMQSELSGAAGGAAIIGVGNIVGSVLKYGSNFLLQRGLGADLYGLYSIGFSLVWLIAPLLNIGLGDTMVRYISMYRAKKQIDSLYGLVIFCSIVSAAAGILTAIFLFFSAPLFATMKHEPRITTVLQVMAFMAPLICTQLTWFGGLQGLKAFKWRVLADRLLPPVALVLLLGATFLFYGKITLVNAGLATLISTLLGTVGSMYFLFRMVVRDLKPARKQYNMQEWLVFASFNLLTSFTEVFLESIDTLLLAFLAVPSAQVGQYNASVKISDFILMPLYSLNTMFAPTISELHSKGEQQKLAAMFQVVTKWTITFSMPIFLIASLFSTALLGLSGDSFVGAWPLLLVSSVGSIANAATGCVGYMLLMTGHQKLSFFNAVAAVVLNIVLGVILTPRYGAMGTAIGTGLSVAVMNVIRLLQVRFLLKVQPYRRDTLKPVAAGLISASITGGLLYLLVHANILVQLALIPIFLASYVACLALFKISSEDKVIVDALLKKFLRNKK